jgi:hypothetical protein
MIPSISLQQEISAMVK